MQKTSIDEDWQLGPKIEVSRYESGRQGLTRINFENLFNPDSGYAEIFINSSAMGQNGAIRRNWTTDVISTMSNLHKL